MAEAGLSRKALAPRIGQVAVLLVGLALLAAGCGGGSQPTATSGSVQGNGSATAGQGVPGAPQPGGQAGVAGSVQGNPQFAGKAGQRRFQQLANTICQTVGTGSPMPLQPPVKPADLHRYAAAAANSNRRTIVSLKRLGAPSSLRQPFQRLIDALQELQSVYAEVGKGGGHGPSEHVNAALRSIGLAEARVGAAALEGGIPICAPHPPGVGPVLRKPTR